MIKKLRKKISFIILFAITVPLFFVLVLFNYSYYNNTIRVNVEFVDKFFGKPKEDNIIDNKLDDFTNNNGIYSIIISNGKISSSSDNVTDKIENYALDVFKNNKDSGIIGDYIYKKSLHNIPNNRISIVFIESSDEISQIKIINIISILIFLFGLILIYILSKKISNIIVRPVEDTFNKQKDFISDASHELKTPLAVIQANADVLEGDIGKNKWLSYIQKETENMGKLISELLLLTKIENVDKLREPEKFNMSDHVELIVSSFESMAFEKKVKLENRIEKDIIIDKFNKDDINHILSTLIDNAIKHTDKGNNIIVELKKDKDKLFINVKNKGKEIPVSERDKIFDRFYRIDKSRNRNEKRYGLGLSIAKAIVLKNNGVIRVDYKNNYTIFSVELPL